MKQMRNRDCALRFFGSRLAQVIRLSFNSLSLKVAGLLCFGTLSLKLVSCGTDASDSLGPPTKERLHKRTMSNSQSAEAHSSAQCLADPRILLHSSGGEVSYVQHGDMLLKITPSVEPSLSLVTDGAVNFIVQRWPNGLIPFVIDSSVIQSPDFAGSRLVDRVNDAMKDLQDKTNIRFEVYDIKRHSYFLRFFSDGNPRSIVGFANAGAQGQNLYVSHTIAMAGIQHELAHALGLLHEENRMDRDEHLLIHADRMDERCRQTLLGTFNTGANLSTPYDFGSIMQSGFNICKRSDLGSIDTMEARDEIKLPTGRRVLTVFDIQEINSLYPLMTKAPSGSQQDGQEPVSESKPNVHDIAKQVQDEPQSTTEPSKVKTYDKLLPPEPSPETSTKTQERLQETLEDQDLDDPLPPLQDPKDEISTKEFPVCQ